MRNIDEKIIIRARNLEKKVTLPKRWIYRLARLFEKGYPIPLFSNNANNYAIEAELSKRRLKRTKKRKDFIDNE